MPRRALLLSLVVCLLPACATLRSYPGPARPPAEVARLAPAPNLDFWVYILEVDGLPLGLLQDRVELAPGTHLVRASVLMRIASREVEATRELELDARAGARYALHAAWGHYGPALFITDGEGSRVSLAAALPAGKLPPVGSQPPSP